MSKIKLGLDIGTNSIGWAVLEKQEGFYDFLIKRDENGELIPSKGSYIFSKSVDANENSKASERRGFRGARRRIDRIRLRKIATLKVLNEFGLCPKFEEGELNQWKNKKIYPCDNANFIEWQRTGKKHGNSETEKLKQPYYLRHLAATQSGMMDSREGKLQLGRAFYHISQRRGYLSNSEEEQSDDKIDLFKTDVIKLLENCSGSGDFIQPYEVIFNLYKSDDKVKRLNSKISKVLKKEALLENIRLFILTEFDKPENLGKVMAGISELTKEMRGFPTLGCYFYSIYNTKDKKTGLINRIRGRYTHREEHYEAEFNHICAIQNITGELRDKLHNAIFYQRPLKSQKGLVAKCTLEPKRKRIALSHPLFEEFRMWESINRIKIKREFEDKLDFLNFEEKELIKNDFLQKTDFEFGKLANKLSKGLPYNYVKRPEEVYINGKIDKDGYKNAAISFNFAMDKKFSACPTISSLKKAIGAEKYDSMPFLNSGHKDEKGKKQISIEDVWHCLQMESFGLKDRKIVREEFAKKHLQIDEKGIETFVKIKLSQGYGSLSKSAIKKIMPFLKQGEIYTNAVFLANVSEVLGRKISEVEQKQVSEIIRESLDKFRVEKQNKGIVNNYISKFKENRENSLGNNEFSINAFRKELDYEIAHWVGEVKLASMRSKDVAEISESCWKMFFEAACDKLPKEVNYLTTKAIPTFIEEGLRQAFPNDKIDVSKLYHPSAMESYPKADKKLGNPEITSIRNPVFDRAMHQVKRLCNELIRNGLVDKDTEVNIEVAGEINSASYRRALSIWQKEQEEIRTWAKEKIIECYPEEDRKNIMPTDAQISKYILYNEQNKKCLYTREEICPRKFLNKQATFDIEHTIPRSKNNDNSLKNKTLANYDFNRYYKKAMLPSLLNVNFNGIEINKESILNYRDNYLKSYSFVGKKPSMNIVWNVSLDELKAEYQKFKRAAENISDAVAHDEVMTKAHYTKMKLDYLREKYRNFEIEEINNQFSNANLVDTRIITKYARAYLNSYFNKVNVVNGKITDTLRKIWGLQGEEDEKDRSNHIHHCIDAIVIACVEKGTVNRISELYYKYENDYFSGNSNPRIHAKEPMKNFVDRMKNLHKEVLIFHKQTDRIRPLLLNAQKEKAKKLNLRGRLNSQNPYAHIKKKDKLIFAQRKSIANITIKDIENIVDDGIKARIADLTRDVGLEVFVKDCNKLGYMILPKFYDENNNKELSEMIVKRIRLESSKSNLKDYKEIRKMDQKITQDKRFDHKHDFYFDKDSYTNYEARIYGDLIPNEKGKFKNREYRVINHHNIVKNIFESEDRNAALKLHKDDMFLVFDLHPKHEIVWDNNEDLQSRLFRIVKFDENGTIVLARHNYAGGDVNKASPIESENNLKNYSQLVLRRSPSTLRVIPAKLDALGKLDVDFSKSFVD